MRQCVWLPAVLAFVLALAFSAAAPVAQEPGIVTTDCEPCQSVAQALNDTIAQARLVGQQFESAEQALHDIEREIAAQEAAREQAEEEHTRKLTERNQKRAAGDEAGADAADAAQRAAFDRVIEIKNDLAFRLEPARDAAQARVDPVADELVRLLRRMKEQYRELDDCEKQCAPPPADGGGDTMPDPPREPTVVDSRGFVVTDCAPCQKLAADLNEVVGTLAARRTELASVEAAIPGLRVALEQAEAAKSRANEEAETHGSEAEKQRRAGNRAAAEAARDREIDAIQAGHRAQSEIDRLAPQLARAEARRAALSGEIAELEQRDASLRSELAECEKRCAGGDEGGEAIEVPSDDPFEPEPEPPEPGFVTTDCELCEEIASALNGFVGTITVDRSEIELLAASIPALEEGIRDAEYEERRALGEYRQQSSFADDYRRRRMEQERQAAEAKASAAWARGEKARAEADFLMAELDRVRKRIEALEVEIAQLKEREAQLRAALAECEKQCAEESADEEVGVALPEDDEVAEPALPSFASTDCAPCEQIVSRLNDVIGSIIATQTGLLPKAREAAADIEEQIAEAEAEKAAAENEFGDQVNAAVDARAAGDTAAAAAADAAGRAAIKQAADLLSEIQFELQPALDRAKAEIARLEQRLADLKAQEQQLRADLAECEKQCAETAPEDDGNVMVPGGEADSGPGVITTDCPACEEIAARLNEAARRLREASSALDEARSVHDEARRNMEAAEAEAAAALEEGGKFADAATRARAAGDMAAVEEAVAGQERAFIRATSQSDLADRYADDLAAADAAVQEALAAYNEARALFDELAKALVECEKKCAEEGERHSSVVPGRLTVPDVGIALAQQEDECGRGEPCVVTIEVTSEDEDYTDPLFLRLSLRADVGTGGWLDDWYCGPADKGSLCYTDEDLASGGTLVLDLPAEVPGGAGAELDLCVWTDAPAYTFGPSVSAAVQLGLSRYGYPVGTIDGIVGPKTKAALGEFLSDQAPEAGVAEGEPTDAMDVDEMIDSMGREPRPDDPADDAAWDEALRRLYNVLPAEEAAPAEPFCMPLRLEPLPTREAEPRTEPRTEPRRDEEPVEEPAPDDEGGPRIGIEFDFGREDERHEEEENGGGGFEIPGFNPLGGGDGGGITFGF